MALDLKPELEVALRDEDNITWATTELDDLLELALEQVNRVRSRVVNDVIALVENQTEYTLVNVHSVFRVDMLDENNRVVRQIPPKAWEIWGDNDTPGQTLYIIESFAREPYKLRVHGYGPYDYTTNEPSRRMQVAILAVARAEALRRIVSDRARFRQWAESNPRGDTSVNELLMMVNESDAEAQRMLADVKLIRRPTTGRY